MFTDVPVVIRTRRNLETAMIGRSSGMNWYSYASLKELVLVGITIESKVRTAVIDPSTVAEKPVAEVPSVTREAGAFGSRGCTPDAEWAVTVAATSVWISSTVPPPDPGAASREYPHEINCSCLVDGVAICSIVLIAVPVATFTIAAVVGIAALKHLYRCMTSPYCPRTV
jgi:hypothetical protein